MASRVTSELWIEVLISEGNLALHTLLPEPRGEPVYKLLEGCSCRLRSQHAQLKSGVTCQILRRQLHTWHPCSAIEDFLAGGLGLKNWAMLQPAGSYLYPA